MAARHLFVCVNERASGKPACGRRGGDAVMAGVQRVLLARGETAILVTPCGCLGPCFDGPNAVMYPEGVWYGDLNPTDAAELAEHLIGGPPVPGVSPNVSPGVSIGLVAKITGRPGGNPDDGPGDAPDDPANDPA